VAGVDSKHGFTEGYGFSNGAKAMLGSSSFSATSFPCGGEDMKLTITCIVGRL